MNQPRTTGVVWMLLPAMLGALACGKNSGADSTGPNGPGSGSAMGPRGVGWWTMPTPNPGTIGGTPGGGGQSGGPSGPGGGNGPGNGSGNGSNGPASNGSGQPVTVPGTTGAPMTPHLPGGGVAGNTALAPGCTPASATECPTVSGACATGAGASVTVTKFGTLCLAGERSVFAQPATTVEYIQETTNGQSYYRFRVTFNPHFVDNTYGVSSIGWPRNRGHRYGDLVKSDHTELQLFNAAGALSLHFKMDYITENTARACGYGTLGVKGGDGSMIAGNPAHVLAVGTSLDRNLNACGYCKHAACNGDCTVDSPSTDMTYATNTQAPNWDFRLVYDVWIAPEAFGASGFGKANISYVHASPAKGGSDTIMVSAKPCPPNWDNPYTPPSGTPGTGGAGGGSGMGTGGGSGIGTGGGSGIGTGGIGGGSGSACPINWQEFLTSEGKSVCVPNATPTPGGGATCPIDWMVFITSEGKATCIPTPTPTPGGGSGAGGSAGGAGGAGGSGGGSGGPVPVGPGNSCPINYEVYVSSEGKATCLPTGGKGGGSGYGVPVGPGNSCPINYEVYVSTEGKATCLPGGTGGGLVPIGDGGTCPVGYEVVTPMEGRPTTCAPSVPGGSTGGTAGSGGSGSGAGGGSGSGSGGGSGAGVSCPIDWTVYVTSEGKASCTPTPRGGSCPIDWTSYLTSEGKTTCVPTPRNGVCPEGYKYDITSEGRHCI